MNELDKRLKKLSDAVPYGAHKVVYSRIPTSATVGMRIRKGKIARGDDETPYYTALKKKMIQAYREILKNQVYRIIDILEEDEQYG